MQSGTAPRMRKGERTCCVAQPFSFFFFHYVCVCAVGSTVGWATKDAEPTLCATEIPKEGPARFDRATGHCPPDALRTPHNKRKKGRRGSATAQLRLFPSPWRCAVALPCDRTGPDYMWTHDWRQGSSATMPRMMANVALRPGSSTFSSSMPSMKKTRPPSLSGRHVHRRTG